MKMKNQYISYHVLKSDSMYCRFINFEYPFCKSCLQRKEGSVICDYVMFIFSIGIFGSFFPEFLVYFPGDMPVNWRNVFAK